MRNNNINVIIIGDIVGRPGRMIVRELLPEIKEKYSVDLVIANAENASGGFGITPAEADELFNQGIDIITMGNHIWDKKEIVKDIDNRPRLLRPANYPSGVPGNGFIIYELNKNVSIGVINVSGRVFMDMLDCPFRSAESIVNQIKQKTNIIIIDFHAEATSEKLAMGWYFDGKVSAVIGTHTHVATADEKIFSEGTAYITDVGMTGPAESILGIKKELIIERFLTRMPVRFDIAKGPIQFEGVILEVNVDNGKARNISRIHIQKSELI